MEQGSYEVNRNSSRMVVVLQGRNQVLVERGEKGEREKGIVASARASIYRRGGIPGGFA